MRPAPRRADEAHRILDTPPEKEYTDIAEILREISQFPTILISLVDEHRQWFKAKACDNFSDQTDRAVSFCDHVVEARELLIVHDATKHPTFSDSPLVGSAPQIRCYIGQPIIPSSTQHCLGTLCCIDLIPHTEIHDNLLRNIERLGNLVGALIDRNLKIALHEANTSLFVAKISHELRTPLHGILGCVAVRDRLLSTNPTIRLEEMEHVNTIAACANGNLRIVNDILDLAKLQHNKLTLQITAFDVRTCLESVLATTIYPRRQSCNGTVRCPVTSVYTGTATDCDKFFQIYCPPPSGSHRRKARLRSHARAAAGRRRWWW